MRLRQASMYISGTSGMRGKKELRRAFSRAHGAARRFPLVFREEVLVSEGWHGLQPGQKALQSRVADFRPGPAQAQGVWRIVFEALQCQADLLA